MSEFLEVAVAVLEARGVPMTALEIVNYATENKMFSDRIAGKTPFQTMKAKLSVDIRVRGGSSRFARTAPGRFFLRDNLDRNVHEYSAPPYSKPLPTERVLTIPIEQFRKVVNFQGIHLRHKAIRAAMLNPIICQYVDRLAAEVSNDRKQVLSYIIVTRRNAVLCYRRGNFNRVEDYLRGSSCIGFGGHVAEEDYNLLASADMGLLNQRAGS